MKTIHVGSYASIAIKTGKPLYIIGAGDITYLERWSYAMPGETLNA